MATKHETYRGSGDCYMKHRGVPGPLKKLANTSTVDFAFEEEAESLRAGKGNAVVDEVRSISDVTATITVHSFNAAELEIGLRAGVSSVASASVTDETVTAYKGGLIRLAHPNPTAVTVTDNAGTTTYAAGTDYLVQPSGIFIPAASSIVDASTIKVDYTHAGYDLIEALIHAGYEFEFHFDGLNDASGKSVLIDAYRFKPGLLSNLQWHGDGGFASFELTGALLADTSKPVGKSQYFRVIEQAA